MRKEMFPQEAPHRDPWTPLLRWGPWVLGASLTASLAAFAIGTWQWPLVGDASLFHYVAFLIDHGFAPYRQIVEINMPGCYLVHWLVIHFLGGGALSWRIFDFLVMAVTGAAMMMITAPYGAKFSGWFAGFAGAGLLTLIHGQDGISFLGERDQVAAALLAVFFAFLLLAVRRNSAWMVWPAALAAGVAGTIKPWAGPAGFLLLILFVMHWKSLRRPYLRPLLCGLAGLLLPLLLVCIYLLRIHALGAFFSEMTGIGLYYNGMYRKSLGYLLVHSVAPIGPLVALWIVPAIFGRRWNWEKRMLAAGALLSLLGYCSQGRGFPYYRYPLLVFLLVLMSIDFAAALRHPVLRYFAALGSIYALLILAPRFAYKAIHYGWRNQEFISMLSGDLNALGGQRLSGKVQCLDTTAGCINTLYRDRLVQATGYIYDCYDYAPRGSERMEVVDRYRQGFLAALKRNPPEVFIVTDQYCQWSEMSYDKLERWPAIHSLLAGQYSLYAERQPRDDVYWWSRAMKPAGYRVYVRR